MGSISLRNASLVVGNGRGKTTLLRAMAGQGDIVCSHGLQIGYVEKDMPAACMNMTLHEMVLAALPATDRDTDSWRVDVVLDEFETPEALRQRPLSQLGGGWQRIALIAQCWALQPDALLLDEPTNHLDLGRLFQLENWFNQAARNIPVVIASHDRQFLDAMTARTLFLRPEASPLFAVPYSKARLALDEAAEFKRERDLKEVSKLRKQAAKLTNIGINSGSDLLVVKSKYLRERAEKIESVVQSVHKERNGDIRLGNSGA